MRPSLVILLVVIAFTAACSTGPVPASQPAAAAAVWTDTVSGGATVQAVATDPATGLLIELQGAPTDPAQPDTSAVLALDPATGRRVWSTLTGNQEPTAVMPYKGLLAIATTSSTSVPSVWVLDARSGAEERSIGLSPVDNQVLGLAGGSIIAADTSSTGGSVSAFSPIDGRELWQRSEFGGCPAAGVAAGRTVAGVLVNCPGNEILLVGADSATGRELWSRPVDRNFDQMIPSQPLSGGEQVTLTANGHIFGVSSEGSVSLYTDSGRLLDTQPVQPYSPTWFTAAGSQVLLAYQSPSGYLTVKLINIATRTRETLFSEPYDMVSAAFSDGMLYINASPPAPLLPTVFIAMDEADRSVSIWALPFAGSQGYYSSLITAGNKVILVPSSLAAAMITAYRIPAPKGTAPPWIQGGAVPGRWPAACSFVPAATISRLAGGPYVAVPRSLPAGTGWPDASTCEYIPDRRKLPLVAVSVAWRAPEIAQASELLRNATAGWTRVPGEREPTYESPSTGTGEVLMQVASTIIEIKVTGAPRKQDALAASIARQIRAGL
jgi:outer membrane protein assembly factor BamB